jgi:hypothetical protein
MPGNIFISYRRGEDSGYAGRLFDTLKNSFDPDRLFMDVDSIEPGQDFSRILKKRVAQSDVLLAVIGARWIGALDNNGDRRLENAKDFVRIEIEAALNQNKWVIPVLVGDAKMPRSEELPESLQPLTNRHAVRVTHERFGSDTASLIKALGKILNRPKARRKPKPTETKPKPAQESKLDDEKLRQVMAALEQHLIADALDQHNVTSKAELTSESEWPELESEFKFDDDKLRRLAAVLEQHDVALEKSPGPECERQEPELGLDGDRLEQLVATLEQHLIAVALEEHDAAPEAKLGLEPETSEPNRFQHLMAALEQHLQDAVLEQHRLSTQKPSVPKQVEEKLSGPQLGMPDWSAR